MLIHPQFDPIAFSIPTPLGVLRAHWYGLMYLAAFMQFSFLGRWRIQRGHAPGWTVEALDDLLFFGALGVVIGGRLGQVFFYEPGYYFSQPAEILRVWKGGLSFHGGLIGVLLAMAWCARKHGLAISRNPRTSFGDRTRSWWETTDFIAPLVPLGLAFGRIGNFINGELWGRPADPSLPWAMIFPHVDALPRHPSQLYQALGEGVLLFLLLWLYASRPRPLAAVSGAFLAGYGFFRFAAEYFRTPDDGIFGLSYTVSMGQWLSLPMFAAGILILFLAYRHQPSTSKELS
ncbi:MAG: prolipoprotein diacylglyceryl transferase [Betaproteobacteria bacterium]|nr:prolipoprotein diacylglyceryl transferase [Betaproteobacteria bacterium]